MTGIKHRASNGHARRKVLAYVKASGAPCWICGMQTDPSIPARHPFAIEADEIEPHAHGGSSYSLANNKAAHRCCNNWRRTKPVWYVNAIRELVYKAFPNVSNPLDFVAAAKRVKVSTSKPQSVDTSTEW